MNELSKIFKDWVTDFLQDLNKFLMKMHFNAACYSQFQILQWN